MFLISAVVITYNEERMIRECLESLRWVDEIILVDAFSSDRTIEIAKGYTKKIFQREWQGYSQQRNLGLAQAQNKWVLFVDADERISDALANEIRGTLARNINLYDGYCFPRSSFYLGRWIKHGEWSSDTVLRLIRNGKGMWSGPSVHEKIILNGRDEILRNYIYHFPYQDISHHLAKFNRYSTLFAHDAFQRGERADLYKILLKPIYRFIRGYFLKQGFRDGSVGFIIASLQGIEVFLRYIKLRELHSRKVAP